MGTEKLYIYKWRELFKLESGFHPKAADLLNDLERLYTIVAENEIEIVQISYYVGKLEAKLKNTFIMKFAKKKFLTESIKTLEEIKKKRIKLMEDTIEMIGYVKLNLVEKYGDKVFKTDILNNKKAMSYFLSSLEKH